MRYVTVHSTSSLHVCCLRAHSVILPKSFFLLAGSEVVELYAVHDELVLPVIANVKI